MGASNLTWPPNVVVEWPSTVGVAWPGLTATPPPPPPQPLSAPRHVTATETGTTTVDVTWLAPLTGTAAHYETRLRATYAGAHVGAWERADTLAHTFRGLAAGHLYETQVRGVDGAGVAGPASRWVPAIAFYRRVDDIEADAEIVVDDVDRQTMLLRLGGTDCRLAVWWQPSDAAWYATLEAPINTVVVAGRRIVTDAGLLDGLASVLSGDIVCRAVSGRDEGEELHRDAWARGTHALLWEP